MFMYVIIKYISFSLTVTKQRDPNTGQHSLFFQVELYLYSHCAYTIHKHTHIS